MSKKYDFTVKDEHMGQVEAIKKACDLYKVSFSAMIVDAIIDSFENGKWAKLLDKDEK